MPLVPIPVLSLTDVPLDKNIGTNEVQIGGVNTSDPRFAAYKSYSGCLSSKLPTCISLIASAQAYLNRALENQANEL